jgi:salicylate hydroxylase
MTKQIFIAGAGLGGLTAAALLLQHGHRVRVFERARELGEIGAGIQLSANATHVLESLGLGPAVRDVAVTPSSFRFKLHDTGEMLHEIPLGDAHRQRFGASYFHVHRADLHAILVDRVRELDPDAIELNAEVVGFEEDEARVEVQFLDGTRRCADLLVGADGINSVLRRQIVGSEQADFTGYVAWRSVVPIEKLPPDFMDKVCTIWIGPGAHPVVYYLRRAELLNFVGLVESDSWREESWTVKDSWEHLKSDFADWPAEVQTVIDAMPKDECYRWALYNRKPVTGWSTARATLLGDAAHPTLPFLASGAAMAIEDGAILARALDATQNVAAALDLYQTNRFERTARVQTGSNDMATLYKLQTVEELKRGFSDFTLHEKRNEWLYGYNPLTVPLIGA